MFFFFFGNVNQEVLTVLKHDATNCPLCKSPASLVEYDNVLWVFSVAPMFVLSTSSFALMVEHLFNFKS